jgi:hypothetical protein
MFSATSLAAAFLFLFAIVITSLKILFFNYLVVGHKLQVRPTTLLS